MFQSSLGGFDELFDGELLKEGKNVTPRITDHDYVMQPTQSPAGSDSGVSLDSSGNSPRNNINEDLTSFCYSMMSESPENEMSSMFPSEYSPGSGSDQLSASPETRHGLDLDALDLENFDFSEVTGMRLDTVDSSALDSNEMDMMEENISIDIGNCDHSNKIQRM